MYEISVNICDPRGIYPKETITCQDITYFRYKNIPFNVGVVDPKEGGKWIPSRNEELFYASIIITKKHFPCFSFFPHSSASINIKSEKKLPPKQIILKTKHIVDGKTKIPILYNPYNSDYSNAKEARNFIEHIRAEKEYIDFFDCKKMPFKKQIELLSRSYEFSDHRINPVTVKKYYNLFSKSSRYIHIALHYFVNASRLIFNHFIEDAGLNLQLTMEALIKDFMRFHSIKNKKRAIKRLRESVRLPYYHMEFLEELYDARNKFLAHIDDYMYTDKQNVSDPDRYCFEHFESICWLIIRYIKYKNKMGKSGRPGGVFN